MTPASSLTCPHRKRSGTTNMLKLLTATAIAVTLGCQAQAATLLDPPNLTRPASYSANLDLNSPAGARIMAHRLRAAATRTCGDRYWTTGDNELYQICVTSALNRAALALNAPAVTALLSGRR